MKCLQILINSRTNSSAEKIGTNQTADIKVFSIQNYGSVKDCQNVVFSKIDVTMTTTNKNFEIDKMGSSK